MAWYKRLFVHPERRLLQHPVACVRVVAIALPSMAMALISLLDKEKEEPCKTLEADKSKT